MVRGIKALSIRQKYVQSLEPALGDYHATWRFVIVHQLPDEDSAMKTTNAGGARHYRWAELPAEQLKGGLKRRLITGQRMMIAHVYFKKGDDVPQHSHENEQITYILEGALRFWLGANGENEVTVRAGEVLVIPPNLPHRAVALEDTLDVDIFDPPRQDWLAGTDAYLRA
jgi:quercetin dioxygenase-like cupin family protein